VLLFYEIILVSFDFIFTLNSVALILLKHLSLPNKPSPMEIFMKKIISGFCFVDGLYRFELSGMWLSSSKLVEFFMQEKNCGNYID